jgi:sugar O-acyltransferase (sialic acid O-acetyltransferase NeuD family)
MPAPSPTTSALPPSRILIVGAGGFGREAYRWACDAWPEHVDRIAGFLSADADALAGHAGLPPIVSDPAGFTPEPGDGLVLGIGVPGTRRRVAEDLASRGGTFLTLVHPTATVTPSAVLGPGSIICPHAVISDAALLGTCVLVNYHAALAHDCQAGDYAVLSPYATLGGSAVIGADTFLGLHASIAPRITVGDGSKVTANSCCLHSAPANSLIHGVPGRVSPLL